jgi:hypothetical protein
MFLSLEVDNQWKGKKRTGQDWAGKERKAAKKYPECYIRHGCEAPVSWPADSSDLYPVNFVWRDI